MLLLGFVLVVSKVVGSVVSTVVSGLVGCGLGGCVGGRVDGQVCSSGQLVGFRGIQRMVCRGRSLGLQTVGIIKQTDKGTQV